jgi:preprotein translocase subunit SecG
MLTKIISIIQLVLAILLSITILMQQRGSGMGAVFGGSSNVYSTKRGVDKFLFYATIVFVILFFVSSLLILAI